MIQHIRHMTLSSRHRIRNSSYETCYLASAQSDTGVTIDHMAGDNWPLTNIHLWSCLAMTTGYIHLWHPALTTAHIHLWTCLAMTTGFFQAMTRWPDSQPVSPVLPDHRPPPLPSSSPGWSCHTEQSRYPSKSQTSTLTNEMKWNKSLFRPHTHTVHIQAKLGQENLLRWVRWHSPSDTGFEI